MFHEVRKNMHLIIHKYSDRMKLIKILRKWYSNLPLQKVLSIVDNLPFEDNDFYFPKDEGSELDGIAEYSLYEGVSFENKWIAPWETTAYLDAKKWYDSLTDENKNKVDILVAANIAYA